MFTIVVDGLQIRLPDSQTTFNPRYAFSCKGSSSLGLKVVETGHLLLPIDAEGGIAVSPGESYMLVSLIEKRKNPAAVLPEGKSVNFKAPNPSETISQVSKSDIGKNESLHQQQNKGKKMGDNIVKNINQNTLSGNKNYSKVDGKPRDQGSQEDEKVDKEKEKIFFDQKRRKKEENSLLETQRLAKREGEEKQSILNEDNVIDSNKSLDVIFGKMVEKSNQLKKQRESDSIDLSKRSRKHPLEDSSNSD